jgi:hypothetical protein
VAEAVVATLEMLALQVVLVVAVHTTMQVAQQSQIIILVLGAMDSLHFSITQQLPGPVVLVRAM